MAKSGFKNTLLIPSYAKINLSLDVLGKAPGGYHELRMIMQTVSLHDDIRIIRTLSPGRIEISCNNRYVPCNKKNIAYKAARLLFHSYPAETAGYGLYIKIIKRIPVAAGLAGGSGNAAAVLKGMNQLFHLSLSNERLCELGLQLGADVPYCIMGGTMLSEGIGEVLTPLPAFPQSTFLLVNPRKPLSTVKIFSSIQNIPALPHPNTERLLELLSRGDAPKFMQCTANSLEVPAMHLLPEIRQMKEVLIKKGAQGALMSGSGPTVFGLFQHESKAREAASSLIAKGMKAYVTTTVQA